MDINGKKIRITFNAPVVLGFTIVCLVVYLLDQLTKGVSTRQFFSVYRSSLVDLKTYIRLFGHVLGHVSMEHFLGNIMMILVVGPMLEEKHGSSNMLFIIISTALVTGLVNIILFPDIHLLGASGVVFAFILLASFTKMGDGEIPLTFILVAVLYIGSEIYSGVFEHNNISNLSHILGGFVGSGVGFALNRRRN